jgi:pimeloyl-ACP methyl ester carboxylesterase
MHPKDQFVPIKITRELAEGIKGAKLVCVDDDHTISRTQPELLITHTAGFLKTVDASL